MRQHAFAILISFAVISCSSPRKFERALPFVNDSRVVNCSTVGHKVIIDNLDEINVGEQLQKINSAQYKSGLLSRSDTASFETWLDITSRKAELSATGHFAHCMVIQAKTPTWLASLIPNENNYHTTLAHRILFSGEKNRTKDIELKELAYKATIRLTNRNEWTMLARGTKNQPITGYVISNGISRILVQPWWQKFQGRKKLIGTEYYDNGIKIAAASYAGSTGVLWFRQNIDPETELVITTLMAGIWKLYPSIAPQLPGSAWQ